MSEKQTGSFRAYAEHRGVSPEAVSKAVNAGRISAALLGNADSGAVHGNGRARLLDFEEADRLWELNTEPRPEDLSADAQIQDARRREAVADADLKEHKRDVQMGLYWLKEDVIRRGRVHSGMVSSAREALPSQLAPQLVGKTDLGEIEGVIRKALRDADKRVADELIARFGEEGTGDDAALE